MICFRVPAVGRLLNMCIYSLFSLYVLSHNGAWHNNDLMMRSRTCLLMNNTLPELSIQAPEIRYFVQQSLDHSSAVMDQEKLQQAVELLTSITQPLLNQLTIPAGTTLTPLLQRWGSTRGVQRSRSASKTIIAKVLQKEFTASCIKLIVAFQYCQVQLCTLEYWKPLDLYKEEQEIRPVPLLQQQNNSATSALTTQLMD